MNNYLTYHAINKDSRPGHSVNTIGKQFKKHELVTCHTARRSFATNGYISNIPIKSLMSITGHKKESTFKRYVQVQKPIDSSKIIEIYGYNSILKKVS